MFINAFVEPRDATGLMQILPSHVDCPNRAAYRRSGYNVSQLVHAGGQLRNALDGADVRLFIADAN